MKLYIDPGTGSMLFTVLIAVFGSLIFLLRNWKVRLGALIRRDRKAERTEVMPLVIFSEGKRYWTNFASVCAELERRQIDTLFLTESEDDPVFNQNFRHIRAEYIGEGNKAFARLNFLQAKVLLSTTPSLDVYQWKRSQHVKWYVHIPHSPNDSIMRYRMFGVDYYDAILLPGAYQINQIRKLEKMRELPEKELVLTGLPYLDEMKQRLETCPPGVSSNRTVLLAPSWGESAILSRYGASILEALLKTGYHIIIRPHPQSWSSEKDLLTTLMKAFPDGEQMEWNRDSDNFESLRRSDILISDFSGVIFDYALVFDKPIIYADTSFDKSPYDCWWLDEELWTFSTLPKIGTQLTEDNLPHMKELIDDCIENPKYQSARGRAREETWCHQGESAKLIADYLIKKINELDAGVDSGKGDDG